MSKVWAMIPARSGSKGLPDKNIMEVAGHPLMAHAISFGLKLGVDRVIVSTDSEKYREIALSYGAEAPFLRGPEASADTAMEEDVIRDTCWQMRDEPDGHPDIWIWLKPTSPFRRVSDVTLALGLLDEQPRLDSVRITSLADARLQVLDHRGLLKPLLPYWPEGRSKIRRTELPQAFKPFNLEVFRHDNWVEMGSNFMGDRIECLRNHPVTGLDVDDRQTFDIVKALIEARPESLAEYIHIP